MSFNSDNSLGGEIINKKILFGAIIVIVLAIIGGLYLIGSSDVTLYANDAYITLPSDYTVDDKAVAYNGDIGVVFFPVTGGDAKDQKALFDALKSNGKDAGYKKITTDEVNGFKLYEYSANPDKLKTFSSDKVREGNYETWKDYEPYTPFEDVSDMDVVQFRYISYVNKDSGDISELYIFTNNTDVDLYSSDIANIVNSISVGTAD